MNYFVFRDVASNNITEIDEHKVVETLQKIHITSFENFPLTINYKHIKNYHNMYGILVIVNKNDFSCIDVIKILIKTLNYTNYVYKYNCNNYLMCATKVIGISQKCPLLKYNIPILYIIKFKVVVFDTNGL
ncbi:hypothetical protein QTP88_013229 [Uroleucon formosanum]